MTFLPTRAGWTGTFSFDLGSKLPGCQGQFRNEEYDEPCPPDTWSNNTWKVALGAAYHQFWNERRIRRNLEFWTDPAFGKYTMLEAQMDAAAVPQSARVVNPGRLRRAFEVFQGMFPERPRWALEKGLMVPAEFKAYPDGQKIYNELASELQVRMSSPGGKSARGVPRFFHFFKPVAGWEKSSPAVEKAFEDAKRYLGLRNQAMVSAWYAKANALISRVPGGEDNFNVRHEWNMIRVLPGAVEVHPWIFQFLDLFGRSQIQLAATASKAIAASKVLPILPKK